MIWDAIWTLSAAYIAGAGSDNTNFKWLLDNPDLLSMLKVSYDIS